MLRAIPHAVVASLAIFTLSDGPVEKAEAPAAGAGQPAKTAAPRSAEPEQGRGAGKATSQGSSNRSQGNAAAKAPAQKAPAQGSAAERTKAEPAKSTAPAVHADAKPCEPVKPCSID